MIPNFLVPISPHITFRSPNASPEKQKVFCFPMSGFVMKSNMRHCLTRFWQYLTRFTAEPPAWPGQTLIPEVEFPPCLAAAQSSQKPLFQWMVRGDLMSLMEILREMSLLKSIKFLLLESAMEKTRWWFYLFPRGFYRDLWEVLFDHSHRNYD